MTRILGIIPARYGSSRFPGKALADVAGQSMVQRVYRKCQAANCLHRIVVATDDLRIFNHVQDLGGEAIMTRVDHVSGTDRCAEAMHALADKSDVVINIQGDEPIIHPDSIRAICDLMLRDGVRIGTLYHNQGSGHDHQSPNAVKVVVDANGRALYFSRAAIPFFRDAEANPTQILMHVGIYGFRAETLKVLVQLPESPLEQAEHLEQLRWMENGHTIHVAKTLHRSHGVDTPEDLSRLLASGLI